jgi:hypothetical protein
MQVRKSFVGFAWHRPEPGGGFNEDWNDTVSGLLFARDVGEHRTTELGAREEKVRLASNSGRT